MRRRNVMKLKNIVAATVIALSNQIVNADCETTKFIGKTSGSAG